MKTKQTTTKKSKKTATRAPLRARAVTHVKKALVPHKDNQYRPHLARPLGIAIVLAVALLAQFSYGLAVTGRVSVLSDTATIKTADLLAETNKQRTAEGLADVQLNDVLSQAAFLKAQDMYEAQYWAHTSPSGVQPWKWFGDVGYNYSFAGENLAKNYPTARATVDAWMNSETHRANLLSDKYVDVGFAVVEGVLENENTTLVVALYGAPVTVAATQVATSPVGGVGFSAPAVDAASADVVSYFASAAGSLSPVRIVILGVLAVVALVGAAAHHYRNKLPKTWQKSWRVHHGLYTFFGMIALGVLVVIASGGGSI